MADRTTTDTSTRHEELVSQTRPHPIWYLLVGIALLCVGFGAFCFWYQDHYHFITSGLRNLGFGGAPWGLHVGFYVIFVGVSFAGITVAAMARLFKVKELQPVTRLAELITITALISGSAAILADLGRPFDGVIKLPRYARPQSPFYGTFTMIGAGYLFSTLVFFFLAGRADAARMANQGPKLLRPLYRVWALGYSDSVQERHRHHITSYWLSLTIFPLLIIVQSTEGFIFGLQVGRPGWYSPLQPAAFVTLAGVSGTGVLIVVSLILRRLFSLRDKLPDSALRWLGNLMWVLAAIYLYFMLAEEMTATYAGPRSDRNVAHAIVTGVYAPYFWLTVVALGTCFVVPFYMFITKKSSITWLGVAASGGIIGAITKRLLIIVPSQTHGARIQFSSGSYTPSWVEFGFVVGLVGLMALLILLFTRFFPIVPDPELMKSDAYERAKKWPHDRLRITVTVAWALVSLSLLGVGLADSLRMWTGGNEIDPRIPYSPLLFAFGVMMMFCTAIVYEALPGSKSEDSHPEPSESVAPEETAA